jgi:hypothetical protein
MTPLGVLLLAAAPVLYWPHPIDTSPRLRAAGVSRLCVPAGAVAPWRKAGFEATACGPSGRTRLRDLGLAARADVAAPTQRPWIDANGWRFVRRPNDRYWYDAPSGTAALAAAEAFAYGVDAILAIPREDVDAAGRALSFLGSVPSLEAPAIADVTVVDDGSAEMPEVLNLLARRNVLFTLSSRVPPERPGLVVRLGSTEFPRESASDPDALALRVRRTLGDANRSLRIYGTEVVLARLQGDEKGRRVHLLNYSGRTLEGVRLRLSGSWGLPNVRAMGERAMAEDHAISGGATEVTLSALGTYAVVDFGP